MIDSRTHATIDAGLSAVLAGLALCPAVSARTRVAAGAAAACVAGYSAVTDYEGGVAARISLQQHRGADAACGVALLAVGATEEAGGRMLMLAGAAQLGLALFSDGHADAGPPDTGYRPLDTPKPFADDLWIVDSMMRPGLPVRMTAIRLPDGSVLLHSPTRYDPALHRALAAFGPITHLVAPSMVHWVFAKPWQDAVPSATVWSAPGLRERRQVRRSGLRIDRELGEAPPAEWGGAIDQVVVRGVGGFSELPMLHRPSRTLMITDLMQNFEPRKLPWVLRPIARVLGNAAPESRAPAHLRAVVAFKSNAEAARRIIGWAPERVVVAHGRPIEREAAAAVRRSLAWML